MDAVLTGRFASIETALSSLLESIKSVNPSYPAADSLLEQDVKLASDLELLERHQHNQVKITKLRQEAEELDQRIKDVVGLLAEARKHLIDLGKAAPQGKRTREVDFKELMAFAKNISKFSQPISKTAEEQTPPTVPEEPVTEQGDVEDKKKNAKGVGWETLPENHKQYFNFYENQPFVPFPGFERIRVGSLATIQTLLDEGKDPALEKLPDLDAQAAGGAMQIDTGAMMPAGPPSGHVATEAGASKETAGSGAAPSIVRPSASAAAPAPKTAFAGFFSLYESDDDD
jgi:Vitamin-D-receptor interacting Mediator subunit 4